MQKLGTPKIRDTWPFPIISEFLALREVNLSALISCLRHSN